jgi:putative chitinase
MTPLQLAKSTGARIDRAGEWLAYIESAMQEFGIDTRLRKAMFLAQIGHESGGLHYMVEIWGNTAAQQRYEGRKDLGNTQSGDGFKYRGRSPIQITGRSNYTKVTYALGVDFLKTPELLELPEHGARAAAWWWQDHKLNRFADADDCTGCTRVINGGYNGLDQRLKLYAAAKLAIPEIVVEALTEVIQEAPVKQPHPVMAFIMVIFKFLAGLRK